MPVCHVASLMGVFHVSGAYEKMLKFDASNQVWLSSANTHLDKNKDNALNIGNSSTIW